MIGKGNHHAHGVKLAAYIMTGDRIERAELIDMRGFGPVSDLRDAFRIEHIRARDGTKADKPFFHVQLRGADGEGLKLTTAQQLEIAERCDKALGLAGQPRAASLHINRQTGDAHLHLGYSLVAESENGQLYVKKLGLYKNKLKHLSREIERDYGLKIVSNERHPDNRARAADRKEVEESRRLGTDINDIRTGILDSLEQSDGGKAFKAALDAKGMMLANGDRRDCFVVIDAAGGQHALNKKLTGQTLAQTRDRLADLDRAQLPNVEQAKALQAERQRELEASRVVTQQAAAQPGRETRGAQERAPAAPEKRPLGKTAAQIKEAWNATRDAGDLAASAAAFVKAIEDRGPSVVYITADEAKASERGRAFAKAIDRQNRALKEGFAVVDERGTVTRIDQRVTGDLWHEIEQRLASIDRASLLTVAEARDAMKEANQEAWRTERQVEREKARPATAIERQIADALASTKTGTDFAAALDKTGLTITRATANDIQALDALRAADISAGTTGDLASGRRFADLIAGDLAAVTRLGDVIRLSPHKLDFEEIEQRLADVQSRLPSVVESRAINEIALDQRAQHAAEYVAGRLEQADAFAGKQELRQTVRAAEQAVQASFETPVAIAARGLRTVGRAAASVANETLRALGGFMSIFVAEPKLTAQQARDTLRAATNEETLHARDVDAAAQANEAARDEQIFRQGKAQQEEDLSFSQRYGTPQTRETIVGQHERDDDRERERER